MTDTTEVDRAPMDYVEQSTVFRWLGGLEYKRREGKPGNEE